MYPVIKTRQYFSFDEMTACIDAVNDLGEFLELEMVVSEEERESSLAHIVEFLEKIGYDKEEIIRTSYLSMLQKK
jgi:adenylate cyclase class 2